MWRHSSTAADEGSVTAYELECVMGWFLTKQSGKPKRKRSARRSTPTAPGWDPRRTLLALRAVTVAAVVLAVGLGWQWSERALCHYVSNRHSAAVAVESVTLSAAPSWMSSMLRRDLQMLVASQVSDDPLDAMALRRAVSALSASPWVARVRQIRRAPAGRLEVHAEYRRPVALVQVSDGYHLVDGQGVRLPGLYLEHQLDELGLPVLVGIAAAVPAPGQAWPGRDVHGGLALVGLLEAEPYMDQVSAIDLSRRDRRGRARLVLRTRTGGMVRWGLPPGGEQSVEPDAATKKQRLAELYRRRGQIDDGGRVVDIFGAAVFVHQLDALNADQARRIGYTW